MLEFYCEYIQVNILAFEPVQAALYGIVMEHNLIDNCQVFCQFSGAELYIFGFSSRLIEDKMNDLLAL